MEAYDLSQIAQECAARMIYRNFEILEVVDSTVKVTAGSGIYQLPRVNIITYKFFVDSFGLLDVEIKFFDKENKQIVDNFTAYESKVLMFESSELLVRYV